MTLCRASAIANTSQPQNDNGLPTIEKLGLQVQRQN
jgi:hypothetical protein